MQTEQTTKVVTDESGNVMYRSLNDFETVTAYYTLTETDTVTFMEDGTVIQLYYYKDTWNTSTKNKQNAKNSRFSAKESFDELFWDIFKYDISLLDKECTYIFILKHVKNRLVLKYNENSLVYLKTVHTESGVEIFTVFDEPYITSEICPSIFYDKVYMYSTYAFRGVLVNHKYMYDFDHYTFIKSIRGNTPDILYRYIVYLQNDKKRNTLVGLYPEFSKSFGQVNKKLYQTSIDIHNMYRCRVKLPKGHEYSRLMYLVHENYKSKAEVEDVYSLLVKQKPKFLYKLLVQK